jgi:hypothetical protein
MDIDVVTGRIEHGKTLENNVTDFPGDQTASHRLARQDDYHF